MALPWAVGLSGREGFEIMPRKAEPRGAGNELADTASSPQLRPSEVREGATPYFRVVLRTPMTFFRTAFPHRTSWKKQRYDLLVLCCCNYSKLL
jgi:hypothetical protein